ncbi:MAG: glycosyltransferase, partial [Marmoricola sp.]|nr:glycosyltransferase [Marmoricola sp.]
MLPRRRRTARSAPELSVVVPVYDVAQYVDDCLESIARQRVDHEVVVVDDGSTDSSVDVVRKRMRRDGRIRLLQQENRGLGAARNAGVEWATGRYLTFVDSDDVVPPGAWAAMLRSTTSTGSDVVVGKAERDDGTRRWATPLMERNHAAAASATSVRENPLLLADVFAWNKLYRRSFWDAAGMAFPEGTRYEDQPAITRALLRAGSVDVLTETVYWWKVRGDRSSITQQRHTLADLRDRIATKLDSARLVDEYVGDEAGLRHVRDVFYRQVLPIDMWEYFRAVPA